MGKNNQETVGVSLAAYNGAQFIARQLDSILSQSRPPDKIVAVDDCSTDGTLQILENYAKDNSAIEVHQNSSNLGYIKNFEKAITLCRTDYVALSDQDDIWHPEKLARCVGALVQNRGAGLCYHNTGLLDAAGERLDLTLWDLSEWTFPLTKKQVQGKVADRRGPLPGFSLVMHRDLAALALPVPGGVYCGHDWWINAIAFFLFDPVCIPESMAYYRMHPGQVSGAADSLLRGTAFEKRKSLFDLERIKRNLKRELYRLLHRRSVLSQKRQDVLDMHNEIDRCLEALRVVIMSSDFITGERQTILADLIVQERQQLLKPSGNCNF